MGVSFRNMIINKTKEKISSMTIIKGVIQKLKPKYAGNNLTVYDDDTFLVSYPKSGHTWVKFFIANYISDNRVDFNSVEKIIPNIYVSTKRHLESIKKPRILKSHECFDPRYNKVIYIVRDPRIVVNSFYWWHMKTGLFEKPGYRNWNFEDYVNKERSIIQISDFDHRANFPSSFISKDYILSQDDIMLNNMHGHIIDPHIGISIFHTVAIFFKQAKSTLYCCAKRLQFFVDNGIWSSRPYLRLLSLKCVYVTSPPLSA